MMAPVARRALNLAPAGVSRNGGYGARPAAAASMSSPGEGEPRMIIVYGTRCYGRADVIDGLGHVTCRFVHIMFVPLIPIQTLFMVGDDRGVKLPFSFKAALSGWLRAGSILTGLGMLAGGVASFGDGEPLLGAACIVVAAIAFGAFPLFGMLFGKCGPERRAELMAMMGLHPNDHGMHAQPPPHAQPAGYGAPPPPAWQPPPQPPHAGPPPPAGGFGHPAPYGATPNFGPAYGAPPPGYGAPPQAQGYGAPPPMYGAPQAPQPPAAYGGPQPPAWGPPGYDPHRR